MRDLLQLLRFNICRNNINVKIYDYTNLLIKTSDNAPSKTSIFLDLPYKNLTRSYTKFSIFRDLEVN
jgi:hypothetical protein